MRITLTEEQMERVEAVVNRQRQFYTGKENGHGARAAAITEDDEIGGFAGELAAALALGCEWHAERTTSTQGPDIGRRTQVRTLTRRSSRRLLVRPYDLRKYGDVPYVLVRRDAERDFTVVGWINGRDIPTKGTVSDGGDRSRPPIYLVDPAVLEDPVILCP